MDKATRDSLRRRYGVRPGAPGSARALLLSSFNDFMDSTRTDMATVLDELDRLDAAYQLVSNQAAMRATLVANQHKALQRARAALVQILERADEMGLCDNPTCTKPGCIAQIARTALNPPTPDQIQDQTETTLGQEET